MPLVLTQPDRPAGRGMKLQASPVKRYAEEHGLTVAQPPSLRRNGKYPAEATAAIDLLRATPHDVMVVAAYGLLLPQEVLDIAPHGCINIHASLLPRWRGAAPIHRAIEAGDTETGITLMQMDVGLDTGAMISEARTPIHDDDTTATLHDRLAEAGARLIVEALVELERSGKLAATPQPSEGFTYAEKIGKHEAALDWRRPAAVLARQVRAFDPFPGGVATLDGTSLKIWSAVPVEAAGKAESRARSSTFRRRAWSWPAARARCVSRNCRSRAASACRCGSSWPARRSPRDSVSCCRKHSNRRPVTLAIDRSADSRRMLAAR